MHSVSRLHGPGAELEWASATGERVFVEQSRKFSEEETRRLAEAAGLRLSRSWASDDYLIAELVRGSA